MKYSLQPLSVEASLELPLDISQQLRKTPFPALLPGILHRADQQFLS